MAHLEVRGKIAIVPEHNKCTIKCNIGDPRRSEMTCSYWDDAKNMFEAGEVVTAKCPKFSVGHNNVLQPTPERGCFVRRAYAKYWRL